MRIPTQKYTQLRIRGKNQTHLNLNFFFDKFIEYFYLILLTLSNPIVPRNLLLRIKSHTTDKNIRMNQQTRMIFLTSRIYCRVFITEDFY